MKWIIIASIIAGAGLYYNHTSFISLISESDKSLTMPAELIDESTLYINNEEWNDTEKWFVEGNTYTIIEPAEPIGADMVLSKYFTKENPWNAQCEDGYILHAELVHFVGILEDSYKYPIWCEKDDYNK